MADGWTSRSSRGIRRAALDLASVDLVVDAPKPRKELGWKPLLLEDRIREAMDWYVATYAECGTPLPAKPGSSHS